LFAQFDRHQEVRRCWRRADGQWFLRSVNYIEQWNDEHYAKLVGFLRNTVTAGGGVFAALDRATLVGFGSVDNDLFGSHKQYVLLSYLHVSNGHRGKGTGRALFLRGCEMAKGLGAKKLYISAHSSEESQAFYRAMGCVEAEEYNAALAEEEPFDCQMEYVLCAEGVEGYSDNHLRS
jgi:predicted N-acetyltransferase YhbS